MEKRGIKTKRSSKEEEEGEEKGQRYASVIKRSRISSRSISTKEIKSKSDATVSAAADPKVVATATIEGDVDKKKKNKKQPAKKNVALLVKEMSVMVTGIFQTPCVLEGIRDGCKGCRVLWEGPLVPARNIHLNTIKEEDPKAWLDFLQKLGQYDFFGTMSIDDRADFIAKKQTDPAFAKIVDKEICLASDLSSSPSSSSSSFKVQFQDLGDPKNQLWTRLAEEEDACLDQWLKQKVSPLQVKQRLAEAESSTRCLFWLHDWWRVATPNTFLSTEITGPCIYLSSPYTTQWHELKEAENISCDTATVVLAASERRNGGAAATFYKIPTTGGETGERKEVWVADPVLSSDPRIDSMQTAQILLQECASVVAKNLKIQDWSLGLFALMDPYLSKCSFSVHKSMLQKWIRHRPTVISFSTTNEKEEVTSEALYLVLLCRMASHRGGFHPELHEWNDGFGDMCKRLAVTACEDSFASPEDIHFLFTLAALAKWHRSSPSLWRPSVRQVTQVFTIGVRLLREPRCYQYTTKPAPGVTVQTFDKTKVWSSNSAYLDALGSFQGDLWMVRSLASAKAVLLPQSSGFTAHQKKIGKLSDFLDQHCCPNEYAYALVPSLISMYPPLKMVAPWKTVFKRAFDTVTGHNPRKHPFLSAQKDLLLYEKVGNAQQMIWRDWFPLPPTVSKKEEEKKKGEKKYEWTVMLDESWLAGGIGDVTLSSKRDMVLLLTNVEENQWKVIPRPSTRSRKEETVNTKKEGELLQEMQKVLQTTGIKWKACPPPLFKWKDASIFWNSGKKEFELELVRGEKRVAWREARAISSSLCWIQKVKPQNQIYFNSAEDGIYAKAWEHFEEKVMSTPATIQRRLVFHMRYSPFKDMIQLPKIGIHGDTAASFAKKQQTLAIMEDFYVHYLLMDVARWFPSSLRYITLGEFQVLHWPLWWHLISKITEWISDLDRPLSVDEEEAEVASASLSASASAAALAMESALFPPLTAAAAKSTTDHKKKKEGWRLEEIGDDRELLMHQKQALEKILEREQKGYRAHFLADRCGAGKTRIASEYLLWFLETRPAHRMPPYIFWVGPPTSISTVKIEFERSKWPIHTWVPLQNPKVQTQPKPFHINFIHQDHVRLCVNEILSLMSKGDSVFFVDEAHESMGSSQRASCIFRASQTASRAVMLSATPSIHTNLLEASPFLKQMVPYPLTNKNIWTAARSMTMCAPPPPWTEKHLLIKASLNEEEKAEYRKRMPPALGGSAHKPTRFSITEAFAIVKTACTRAMIEKADSGTVVWASDQTHQAELVAGFINQSNRKWKEKEIVQVTKTKKVELTDENRLEVETECKILVVPKRCGTSANYQRFNKQMEIEEPGNLAKKQQRHGRIGRTGQIAKELFFITVVDDMGCLERLRLKHQLPAEIQLLLRSLCFS